MAILESLQSQNNHLTNALCEQQQIRTVMASIESTQDVVNNPQSTVSQPVDASGNNDIASVPSGANATTSQPASTEETAIPPHNAHQSTEETVQALQLDGKSAVQQTESQPQEISEADLNQADDGHENETFEIGSYRSADIDGSLGSDADVGKSDGNGKDAIPKYTVKKAAGFKPVSMTKSFLAKAGTAVPPLKSVASSEKTSLPNSPAIGSATSTTRPRLVAKTLSSSKNAPLVLGTAFKRTGADGPDPNQVWNRNRVQMAPQATPKHMTDEELKNRYGIELASRPLESADPNQTKWADLEDEDEDWAVDDLKWSDGFKPNPTSTELVTPAATMEDPLRQENQSQEKPARAPKMSLGPKATVLKLGSGVIQPIPVSTMPATSSAPKNPGDKPTLVAKPSPAPPAKSPWAQLPPVDKVSPIAPPVQVSASRFPHSASFARDSMPPSQQPAREIAADDYSRIPANGAPRELFNSQSGRYEPVPDSRRMSIKKDGGFRAAGVLQRPAPGDSFAPAEPSPAFQTTRTSSDAWRRRRASSNVSNDSGPFARRLSMNRPVPDGSTRRDSTHDSVAASGYGPSSGEHQVGSPAISYSRSATSQQSPMLDHAPVAGPEHVVIQTPITTVPTSNMEEELARQKKLMRERAEAAMKRRKEEEEREEAERKERLRKKLESLKPKPAEAIIHPATTQPEILAQVQQVQDSTKTTSSPKPPVPGSETQRYGMMTLHSVTQTGANVGADGRVSQIPLPEDPHTRLEPQRAVAHGRPQQILPDTKLPQKPLTTPLSQPLQQSQQHPAQPGHPGNAWDRTSMPSHSSHGVNVWGPPPTGQKALGNGDFHQNVTQIHLPQVSAQQYPHHLSAPQTQAPPQPIGTPRQHLHQQQGPLPPPPPAVREHSHQAHPYHVDHPAQHGLTRGHAQQSIAPAGISTNLPNRPPGISAWADFAKNAPIYDAQKKAQMAQEAAAAASERERSGITPEATKMHETWTQVSTGDEIGARRVLDSSNAQRDLGAGDAPHHPANQPFHARSRYQDLFAQNERSAHDFIRPHDPLTPPPEEGNHPVFLGGPTRPKVRLPGSIVIDRPTPIVRLPIADAYQHPSIRALRQQSMHLPLSPSRGQPVVTTPAWQERFDVLLNITGQHPQKGPVDTIGFSTSKEPLEHDQRRGTPVSLPPQDSLPEDTATKDVEDEVALFEESERELGSRPPVHIPRQAPRAGWHPAKVFVDMRKIKLAILNDSNIYGASIYHPHELPPSGDIFLYIKLPNMESSKRLTHARPHLSGRHRSSLPARGPKSRNSSGQHNTNKSKEGTSPIHSPITNTPHASGRVPSGHAPNSRRTSGRSHNWSSNQPRAVPAPAAVH